MSTDNMRSMVELLVVALAQHRNIEDAQLLELAMDLLDQDIIEGEFTIVYNH